MTVRELIDKLEQCDPALEVWEFNEDNVDWAPFEEPFEPQKVTMYRIGTDTWVSKQRWSSHRASAEDRKKDEQDLVERAEEEKLVIGL